MRTLKRPVITSLALSGLAFGFTFPAFATVDTTAQSGADTPASTPASSVAVHSFDALLARSILSPTAFTAVLPDPDPVPTDPDPVPTDPDPVPTDPDPVPTDPDPVPTDPDPVPTDPDPVLTDPEPDSAPVSDPVVSSTSVSPVTGSKVTASSPSGPSTVKAKATKTVKRAGDARASVTAPDGYELAKTGIDSLWLAPVAGLAALAGVGALQARKHIK